jgi:hypothetical protein
MAGKITLADKLSVKINDLISNSARSSCANLSAADPKKLWREIKDVTHPSLNSLLIAKTGPFAFNRFFANISFSDVNPTNYSAVFGDNSDISIASDDETLPFLCSNHEVAVTLQSISNTAPGLDGVPAWFFRHCSVELADLVASLFNQSLLTGCVPVSWLRAIVSPVPKINKPSVLTDFRPISVTPILSRLLENIVVKKYLQPCLSSDLIRDQYAYKPTGSTSCALVDMMHFVTKQLESCKYVRCLMVDLSKAFDTVDRTILLSKLATLDLPVTIKNWVANFLSDRTQITICNGHLSNALPVNLGVVQGSALGPTLFTIMVHDLKPLSSVNDLIKFADDLTLLVPEHSDISVTDEFSAIRQWAAANKLSINTSKTKEIVFHRPRPSTVISPPPIEGVERVFLAKLLGVTINSTLNFSEHVAQIVSQCNQRSFLLRSLRRRGMRSSVLEAVFTALIVSRILYAISAWGGFVSSTDIRRIDSLFFKCRKFGYCQKTTTFEHLLLRSDKRFFRKVQNKNHCLNHLLPTVRSTTSVLRDRGHPFTLPHCTFDLFKRSFITRMLFSQI